MPKRAVYRLLLPKNDQNVGSFINVAKWPWRVVLSNSQGQNKKLFLITGNVFHVLAGTGKIVQSQPIVWKGGCHNVYCKQNFPDLTDGKSLKTVMNWWDSRTLNYDKIVYYWNKLLPRYILYVFPVNTNTLYSRHTPNLNVNNVMDCAP